MPPTRLTLLGRGFDKALRLADFRSRMRTQRLCLFMIIQSLLLSLLPPYYGYYYYPYRGPCYFRPYPYRGEYR